MFASPKIDRQLTRECTPTPPYPYRPNCAYIIELSLPVTADILHYEVRNGTAAGIISKKLGDFHNMKLLISIESFVVFLLLF